MVEENRPLCMNILHVDFVTRERLHLPWELIRRRHFKALKANVDYWGLVVIMLLSSENTSKGLGKPR